MLSLRTLSALRGSWLNEEVKKFRYNMELVIEETPNSPIGRTLVFAKASLDIGLEE